VEPVERLGGRAALMLDQSALVVHVDTETHDEHASKPSPLIEACRGGEVGDDLLDVPLPAQGAMSPLLGMEARQVLRRRSPFGVHQRLQVFVPRFRHIARSPSHARESITLVGGHRSTGII
jgi:hypothetical protein